MKIIQIFAAAVLLTVSFAAAAQDADPRARETVDYTPVPSGENEFTHNARYIHNVVKSYVDVSIDISEPSVTMEIYAEIGKHLVLSPKTPADLRTDAMIAEEVDKIIKKKYTKSLAEYRKELEIQAEKKFRLYQFGEKVTLRYQAGNRVRSVTGKFGQFNGRGVTIGYRHIPFYDLLEEDKAHVSKEYAAIVKEKYVQKSVNDYIERRNSERFSRISLIRKQIMAKNRGNGYLYLDNQWLTPKQVTDQTIREQIKQHPEILRNRAPAAKTAANSDDTPIVISTDNINKTELKQKTAKIKNHLAGQSKIDQDSGCLDAAYWGFTREEVKVSLSGSNMRSTRKGDEIYPEDRQIDHISLFYQDNKLVKLEEVYLISDVTSFNSLKISMTQKYGTPDGVKDIKLVPQAKSVTWTGKYTTGTLMLERDSAEKIIAAKFLRQPKDPAQPFGKDIQL